MRGARAGFGTAHDIQRRPEVAVTREIGLLGIVAILGAPSQPPPDPLLARAAAYVERFEHDFRLVVSDEDYRQRVTGALHRRAEQRRTRAEMLFMWVPDSEAWLTVRNVLAVDGRAIASGGDRLRQAFAEPGDPLEHLRRLRDESARYNLGTVFRNINYPTLALQFLESKKAPRFTFTSAGSARVDGLLARKFNYDERQEPTVVEDDAGRSMFASGTLWIAEDGTILRTTLHIVASAAPLSMEATVDYRWDTKLAMRVPVRMDERYVQLAVGGRRRITAEQIDGTAAYSNFRRFETAARIIQ